MSKEMYDAGMAMRRKVVGDEYVDKSLANATELDQEFQDFVSEYCWGAVWTREGLAPRDRSLLNLGMLVALNRIPELKVHIRGAINNGVQRTEIREALFQSAVYCGVPAALEAFRAAKSVFAEIDAR
ncbi:MAG: 4-carboxymuconolactone decarboxylase [Gammaproteobacteria bacterium]